MLRRLFALVALLVLLAACGTPPTQTTALNLVAVTPDDGATDVSRTVVVTARFDQPIDADTLAGNFTLTHDDDAVAGVVTYVRAARTARFTPEAELEPGSYTARLSRDIRSEAGVRLTSEMVWSFVVVASENDDNNDNGDNGAPPPDEPGPVIPIPSDPDANGEPPLSFLRPVIGSELAGTVPILVEADDPDAITAITLYAQPDGSDTAQRIGNLTRIDDAFQTTWDTTLWPTGAYRLIAVADTTATGFVSVSVAQQLPSAAFLTPTPNKRTAGIVDVTVDLDAPRGIRSADLQLVGADSAQRIARLLLDPNDDRRTAETLTAQLATIDYETGAYTLRIDLEDAIGNTTRQELGIEFLTPFVITTPTDGDSVGGERSIVAVTIGVNGTILDDYDVTTVDLYINGSRYAEGIPVDDDATSTRLIVYPWDTDVAGPGHPSDRSGDRALTARVTFVDPDTGTSRTEFTPGVIVSHEPTIAVGRQALSFLRPIVGSELSGTVPILVEADDPDAITTITLYAQPAGSGSGSPEPGDTERREASDTAQRIGNLTRIDDTFQTTWDTTPWPTGAYRLIAVADTSATGFLDVSVAPQLPSAAFLTPTPSKRAAGIVDVTVDLAAPRGIRSAELHLVSAGGRQLIDRLALDPNDEPSTNETFTAQFATIDHETGTYALRLTLLDAAGNTTVEDLEIELLTPFVITTPTDGEAVGPSVLRRIVAVTIGVNGTILDDYDVTTVDLYINGSRYAEGIPVDDATSTRLIVYPWDTLLAGPGHDPEAAGDRVLTARVTFVDPETGVTRTEFTPGVIVNYVLQAQEQEEEEE